MRNEKYQVEFVGGSKAMVSIRPQVNVLPQSAIALSRAIAQAEKTGKVVSRVGYDPDVQRSSSANLWNRDLVFAILDHHGAVAPSR